MAPSNMTDTELAREVEHHIENNVTNDAVKMMCIRFTANCAMLEELDERGDELENELKREQDAHQEVRAVLKTVHQWVQFYNQPQWRAAWESEIPKMIGLTHHAMEQGQHLEIEIDLIVRNKVDLEREKLQATFWEMKKSLDAVTVKLSEAMRIQFNQRSEYDDDIPF